jgi:hypothetical protein
LHSSRWSATKATETVLASVRRWKRGGLGLFAGKNSGNKVHPHSSHDYEACTLSLGETSAALWKRLTINNAIYQSDPGLPGNQPFISVIDAVPADGFNPIWEEVQIAFAPGHTPRQLFSDNEVLAAAASGEVTLTLTGEVYWCPVVGPGPNH